MSIVFSNLFFYHILFILFFIFLLRIYTQGRCDTQVVTSVAKLEPVVSPPYSVVVIVVMIVITFCLFSRQMQNYNLIFIFNFHLPTQNLKISNSEFFIFQIFSLTKNSKFQIFKNSILKFPLRKISEGNPVLILNIFL